MPIYEYQCNRCNEVFEIFHKIDEDCKVTCPKCLRPAKRLISATNFVLKRKGQKQRKKDPKKGKVQKVREKGRRKRRMGKIEKFTSF